MSTPDTEPNSERGTTSPDRAHATTAASQPATGTPPPQTPPAGTPPAPGGPAEATPHKRPWGWIALAGILAAAVVGLGIWALSLNSDLDDANARVDSQQAQIEQAQDTGADVTAAAREAYDQLTAQFGAAQEDASQAAEQAAAQLSEAQQAAEDAKGTAEEVQKEADAAQAKADAAATCAQSFLAALSGVFGGATLQEGVEAAVAELRSLQPQCAGALGDAG